MCKRGEPIYTPEFVAAALSIQGGLIAVPAESEKEDAMPENDEARDALAEAMFRAAFSDPRSEGVDREWMKRGQYENGYRAEIVLGLLHDAGFDVVKVDV